MNYQVTTTKGKIRISGPEAGVELLVSEPGNAVFSGETAFAVGTLYRIGGDFLPDRYFVFEAGKGACLEEVRKGMDFFFQTILETELYVKEVPPHSALYAQEAVRLFGETQAVKS